MRRTHRGRHAGSSRWPARTDVRTTRGVLLGLSAHVLALYIQGQLETEEVEMPAIRSLILATVAAAAATVPLTASAQPPTVVTAPVNDVQVLSGPDSPCAFDLTFTGTGTIAFTTF